MKDIYELLNDIDIKDYEEAPVSKFEKEKIKHSLNEKLFSKHNKCNKKVKFLIIAAASILIFLTSSVVIFSNPTLASNIPIVNEFLQKLYGNENIDFIKYSDFIGQTVEKNGVKLNFNSVVISDDSMFLDFTIKTDEDTIKKENLNNALMMPQKIKINNIDMPTNGKTSWDLIDDNTIRLLETIDLDSIDYTPEGKLNVEINIYEVFNVKDTFAFKFEYDKTNHDEKSISKTYDTKVDLDDKNIIVNKASVSPLTCSINFTSDYDNTNKYLGFVAIDNNNNLLNFTKSSGLLKMDSPSKYYLNSIFYISNKDMKQVTFIPYTADSDNHSIIMNNKKIQPIDLNNTESFKINVTDDFGIMIKELILDGDYLVVNYNNLILGQESSRSYDTLMTLSLISNNSKVPIDDCSNCEDLYKKYENNNCSTSIFKVSDKNNLALEIEYNENTKFFKDKSITLDLPQ